MPRPTASETRTAKKRMTDNAQSAERVVHQIAPVWNAKGRVLILGTMPSPKSREAGFFYMHPQNRFWPALAAIFGERFEFSNSGEKAQGQNRGAIAERSAKRQDGKGGCQVEAATRAARKEMSASGKTRAIAGQNEKRQKEKKCGAIAERRDFLTRHDIALWDVLAFCEIEGASDATIKNAAPNDFTEIFERSKIRRVFCAGKTAFRLWQKFCAEKYEARFGLTVTCLPSPSPANACWSLEKLIAAYKPIAEATE